MRLTILSALLGATLVVGMAYSAPQQDVTQPEWVVIFNLKHDPVTEPLVNLRVVIHAKSEGAAVMKATIHINNTFGVNATDKLEFVEAALKK